MALDSVEMIETLQNAAARARAYGDTSPPPSGSRSQPPVRARVWRTDRVARPRSRPATRARAGMAQTGSCAYRKCPSHPCARGYGPAPVSYPQACSPLPPVPVRGYGRISRVIIERLHKLPFARGYGPEWREIGLWGRTCRPCARVGMALDPRAKVRCLGLCRTCLCAGIAQDRTGPERIILPAACARARGYGLCGPGLCEVAGRAESCPGAWDAGDVRRDRRRPAGHQPALSP